MKALRPRHGEEIREIRQHKQGKYLKVGRTEEKHKIRVFKLIFVDKMDQRLIDIKTD